MKFADDNGGRQYRISYRKDWMTFKTEMMKFNNTKCKVIQLGANGKNFCYKLKAHELETEEEKDVGVLVNHSMTEPAM